MYLDIHRTSCLDFKWCAIEQVCCGLTDMDLHWLHVHIKCLLWSVGQEDPINTYRVSLFPFSHRHVFPFSHNLATCMCFHLATI